jgi:hypothetical protein
MISREMRHGLVRRLTLSSSNPNQYIQAALVFLERSKDIYPDAYKRATDDYNNLKSGSYRYQDLTDLRDRLQAIVNEEGNMASQ